MDPMTRSQADVLGIPLLDGLGTAEGPGTVWRSGNMEAVSLVHSYNLPPEQELLMEQCSQHLLEDTDKSQHGTLFYIKQLTLTLLCL